MSLNSAANHFIILTHHVSHDGTGKNNQQTWEELQSHTSQLHKALNRQEWYEVALLLASKLREANSSVDASASLAMAQVSHSVDTWRERSEKSKKTDP